MFGAAHPAPGRGAVPPSGQAGAAAESGCQGAGGVCVVRAAMRRWRLLPAVVLLAVLIPVRGEEGAGGGERSCGGASLPRRAWGGTSPLPFVPGPGGSVLPRGTEAGGGIGEAAPMARGAREGTGRVPKRRLPVSVPGRGAALSPSSPLFFFFLIIYLVFWLFFHLTDRKNTAELSAHLPRWKACLVLNLWGEYVLLAPVGPLGTREGNPWKGLGGVSGRWGALLELGFHFRKERGVTAIPGQQLLTRKSGHTIAFKRKEKYHYGKTAG